MIFYVNYGIIIISEFKLGKNIFGGHRSMAMCETEKKFTTAELINELRARGLSEDEITLLLMEMPVSERSEEPTKAEDLFLQSSYAPIVSQILMSIGVPAHIRGIPLCKGCDNPWSRTAGSSRECNKEVISEVG